VNGSRLHHPWLELALRWLLGLTFVYSSFHKIADPAQFAKIVFGYSLFPPAAINLVAIVVPFVELVAGGALLLGIWPRAAALVVETLLVLFFAILSINLVRGVSFDCGCFGFAENGVISPVGDYLARDALYLLAGLQVLLYKGRRKWCLLQTDNSAVRPPAAG
jgi:uncharacterized membrane protein YphA (DoxX/SURF4 family)